MNKIIVCLSTALLSLVFIPADGAAKPKPETQNDSTGRASQLVNRLNEISRIDKTTLSHGEKKALHKEMLADQKELRRIGGGIYISAGAVILILILVIIFL